MTQMDLSVLAGLDVSTVSRIERGVADPTLLTGLRLAITLECELEELFSEDASVHVSREATLSEGVSI